MTSPTWGRISQGLPDGVLVDAEDMDKIGSYRKWFISTRGDVYAQIHKNGKTTSHKIHRVITNAPVGMDVDHINGNPLDNRRVNLRICTHAENSRNTKLARNNTSGHIGVSWDKSRKKWSARIKLNYKDIYIGRYETIKDAIEARLNAENKYFGDFAPSRSRI